MVLAQNASPEGSQDALSISIFVDEKVKAWEQANPCPEITVPSDAPEIAPRVIMEKDWALNLEAMYDSTLKLTLHTNSNEKPIALPIMLNTSALESLVTILLHIESQMEMNRLWGNHGKRLYNQQKAKREDWEAARDKATVEAFQEWKRLYLK